MRFWIACADLCWNLILINRSRGLHAVFAIPWHFRVVGTSQLSTEFYPLVVFLWGGLPWVEPAPYRHLHLFSRWWPSPGQLPWANFCSTLYNYSVLTFQRHWLLELEWNTEAKNWFRAPAWAVEMVNEVSDKVMVSASEDLLDLDLKKFQNFLGFVVNDMILSHSWSSCVS